MSMGDFSAIGDSKALAQGENILFWLLWGLTVCVTCIIFLNFIVAEASASYTKVTETLKEVIQQEKAALIAESEDMALERLKNKENYPRYVVVRQIES